jgi:predicted Zn finger-like uncharacterized protein
VPNILCPKCDSTLAIDDSSVGQMVQCGSCQNVFKAAVAPPSKADDEDERPSKRKSKRRYEDDDEDERPSKRRSSKRGDDDDDEDEDEDRPRKKKGRKHYHDEDDEIDDAIAPTGSNGMATASLVLGIIALVIELPSFGGTIFGTACCPFCGILFWPAHALAALLAIIGLILGLLAMKNPVGKGAWMAGLILSAATLLFAIASILLNVLGFAVIATMPTQPTQNWNQPVQPQPRPVPPRRG